VTLPATNGNNLTFSDLLSSIWPKNSKQLLQNCSFFFRNRVSISPTKKKIGEDSSCQFEFNFSYSDARTTSDKIRSNEFRCINQDPLNYIITLLANQSRWEQSVLHFRKKTIFDNGSAFLKREMSRRHVVMKRPLSEKICSDEMLPKFNLKNGDKSVDFERRFEILNGIDVCSVMIEMPFGFIVMISVTLENNGK
jgi:hypothetical protein